MIAIALAMALLGCERKSAGPLTGGYRVFAASPSEVAVLDPQNSYIVGPQVESIGVASHHIVAHCRHGCVIHQRPMTAARFALIDTTSGEIRKADTVAEAEAMLGESGVAWPTMRNPSSFMLADDTSAR